MVCNPVKAVLTGMCCARVVRRRRKYGDAVFSGRPGQHPHPDAARASCRINCSDRVKTGPVRLPDRRAGIIGLARAAIDVPAEPSIPPAGQDEAAGRIRQNATLAAAGNSPRRLQYF